MQVGDHNLQQNFFTVQRAAAAPVALAQLPPLAAVFTGREAELALAAGLLDPAGGAGAVVVSAVAGLAGVGKTALTVHAAHAAREAGWFAGGVLFIDLHGYDEQPVQPRQALDALLRALGVPGEHVPEETEQRVALYRSALDQVGDPVLVVIDNASAEAQVRPLLPGPGPHRVVITSRHVLGGLGARLLEIAVLDQATAIGLLDELVRVARPGDDRVGGDHAAAAELAGCCGGLPLALQIAGALLVSDPALSAAELAGEMSDEARRLEVLRYEDSGEAGASSVAAAFELSYRRLDKDAARLFRLLPSDRGPDVSTGAAAALAGWPVNRARAALGRLCRAHLAEPAGGPGRWRMHDLLRLFARQVPERSPGEREQAAGRLLGWYHRHACAANLHLQALAGEPVPSEFAGRDEALGWLDAQRPNLVAAVAVAAAAGRDREAIDLPLALSEHLSRRRRFDDLLQVLAVSRDTARRLGDRYSEGAALGNLGLALREVRRFDEAVSAHQENLAICQEIGDRHRGGLALNHLGAALAGVRRFDEAVTAHQNAVAIFRRVGDRRSEAGALGNLGLALREVRRFDEAVSAHQENLAICREIGDRHGEGMALGNLGLGLLGVRRFDEAVTACQNAAVIYRQAGDRHGEGLALGNLGEALMELGRFDEAVTACQNAAVIFRQAGDRHGEGMALVNLGAVLKEAGRLDEAALAWQAATGIFREVSDLHGEGMALNNLAAVLKEAGRLDEAATACRDAAGIFREDGDQHNEGIALRNLSLVLQKLDDTADADQPAAHSQDSVPAPRGLTAAAPEWSMCSRDNLRPVLTAKQGPAKYPPLWPAV